MSQSPVEKKVHGDRCQWKEICLMHCQILGGKWLLSVMGEVERGEGFIFLSAGSLFGAQLHFPEHLGNPNSQYVTVSASFAQFGDLLVLCNFFFGYSFKCLVSILLLVIASFLKVFIERKLKLNRRIFDLFFVVVVGTCHCFLWLPP